MEGLKNSPFCKSIRLLLIILLLPVINIVVQTYQTYTTIQEAVDNYNIEMKAIKTSEWLFVNSVLKENKEKAKMQAEFVKDRIQTRLLESYGDNMHQLQLDLNSESENTTFKIMNEEIAGKYLNVNNDNNDMFIATNKKVIVDKSINCSIGKLTRTWDEEISLHANPELANNTIRLLITKSTAEKFWQFLPHDFPIETELMVKYPSMDGLKAIYERHGLNGLRPYEFLVPAYIKQDSDIFNVPDVSLRGIKNDNNKIIVVQGFNLVDAIEKDYLVNISHFKHLEELAQYEMKAKRNQACMELVMNISLLIASFIGILAVSQIMIKWGGDDAIRGCKD